MSLFSRLFRPKLSAPKPKSAAVEYQGFQITPQPMKEAQGFRLCALIEKEVDGELKSHQLIRADTISDFDVCVDACVDKAKQMIDQQGARIFK